MAKKKKPKPDPISQVREALRNRTPEPLADLTPDQIAAGQYAYPLKDTDLQDFLGNKPATPSAGPPTTPTRGKDSVLGIFDGFLGEKAAASKLLSDIDNGIKIEPTDANVKALIADLGIDLPTEKASDWTRNIKRLLGRSAGDIGKEMDAAGTAGQLAKAKYAANVAGQLRLVADAAGGDAKAIKALETGKAAGWAKDTLRKIKPSFGQLAIGAGAAIALQPVVGGLAEKFTGESDAKRELNQMNTVQTFDDLWEQYQLQKAMSRAQSRMNVDFPTLMGGGGGGGPAGAPTEQMPVDPRANPGDIVLPGGQAQYDEQDYNPVA